ncbi:MAG: tyrosinase family protein [Symploca sp. SIO2C1]|nr:tyrosinase family protein [Symploca sp. SIO2C1]
MAKILAKFTPEAARFPSTFLFAGTPISARTATGRLRASTISYRKNIRNLTDDELAALREAFTRLYEMRASDDRSYQYIAGVHGFPTPVYCAHGDPLFTVWHRPYMLMLEKSLQEQVPGVTIPYWDWTSEITQQEGMPRAYTDETDPSGNPNPLLKANIEFPGSQFTETFRDPGPLSTFRRLVGPVRRAQRVNSTYTSYSTALENPHNAIHGWVGGVMGIVSYAAYDPIFWAHHCNIDRLFAEWQAAHPNITPNDMIWTAQLTPFGVTTADIWDIRRLGYDYLTAEAQPIVPADEKFGDSPIVGFALGAIEPEFEKAELEFQNLMHPRSSFEVRVFFNQPDANASTPMEGNDNYAGSLFLFGHGECQGEEGHCAPDRGPIDEFDIRRPSHVQPFSAYVDVTEAIRSLGGSLEVTVKLVAVDTKGNPITNPGTDFDAIALITT